MYREEDSLKTRFISVGVKGLVQKCCTVELVRQKDSEL